MQRIHRGDLAGRKRVVPGLHGVGTTDYSLDDSTWTCSRIRAQILDNPVLHRLRRNDICHACCFRSARPFKVEKEKEAVLFDRPSQRSAKNVADQFWSLVARGVAESCPVG